jgi:hypothetical protein
MYNIMVCKCEVKPTCNCVFESKFNWISDSSSWWPERDELSEMVSDCAELSVSWWSWNWNLDRRERQRRRVERLRERLREINCVCE